MAPCGAGRLCSLATGTASDTEVPITGWEPLPLPGVRDGSLARLRRLTSAVLPRSPIAGAWPDTGPLPKAPLSFGAEGLHFFCLFFRSVGSVLRSEAKVLGMGAVVEGSEAGQRAASINNTCKQISRSF